MTDEQKKQRERESQNSSAGQSPTILQAVPAQNPREKEITRMKIIQNERDFEHLRMEGDIDTAVLSYIEDYFKQFAVRTDDGLTIQDVGMIVILEEGDRDMLSSELLLPSVFRSVPEETKLIPIRTSTGNIIEVFQSLFLPNNEMGIDLFCVKDAVSKKIQDRLIDELEGNGGIHHG